MMLIGNNLPVIMLGIFVVAMIGGFCGGIVATFIVMHKVFR